MKSLQTRLALWLISSVVLLFGVHWLLASYAPRAFTEAYVVSRLQHDAEGLLTGLRLDQKGQPTLDPRYMAPIYNRPYSGHYFVLEANGSRMYSRSFWDRELELTPPADEQGEDPWHMRGFAGEPLLVWRQQFEKGGQAVSITVAEDLSDLDGRIARFQWIFGLGTLVALIVLVLAQRYIVRRSLAPLQTLGEACRRLDAGEIERLPEDGPIEVQPLVHEVNRLLLGQRERLERSRRSLGNLAHALKTPLTLAQHLLHRAGSDMAPSVRQDLERAMADMGAIVGRELKRARLAGEAAPGQRVALFDELRDLTGVLHQIHADRPLEVSLEVPADMTVRADREDLLELLGNLLDNAFKWAHGRILVHATADRGLDLRIEDDGPGVPPEELERLTARGLRLDESQPGHGLGLGIAQDIVAQYGGELRFDRSPALGGLQVHVRLPP